MGGRGGRYSKQLEVTYAEGEGVGLRRQVITVPLPCTVTKFYAKFVMHCKTQKKRERRKE